MSPGSDLPHHPVRLQSWFHFSPPTANRSSDDREMRTRRPIFWIGSSFERMSLSKVRIEIERVCAAWRLLSSICSGIFASVPRGAREHTIARLPFAPEGQMRRFLRRDLSFGVLAG